METDRNRFAGFGNEPPIADMLKDPIVHLVMRRDNVREETLVEVIESARRSIVDRKSSHLTRAA